MLNGVTIGTIDQELLVGEISTGSITGTATHCIHSHRTERRHPLLGSITPLCHYVQMDPEGVTHSVDLSTDTQATPAAVWAVLTDIDAAAQALSGIDRVERVDGPRYGVGTRWRETRTMFGRAVTEEMWVAEVDEGSRTVVEAESSGLQYSTTFTLEPVDGGTRITMNFSCHMPYPRGFGGFMFKRSGKVWVKATSKTMQKDLDDIARAAEQREGS